MKKRKQDQLASVMFSYVGTDQEFNDFLKMLLHDYLSADQPYMATHEKIVRPVESNSF